MQEITNPYDGKFAVLKVTKPDGEILLASDHFLITSFNETDQERTSVHYTAGDASMYVGRGRQPRVHTYGGILTDTIQNGRLIAAWLHAYERYLRGTRCVRNNAYVEILQRDRYRKGYLTASKMDHQAAYPNRATFSFSMFVIDKGVLTWHPSSQTLEF